MSAPEPLDRRNQLLELQNILIDLDRDGDQEISFAEFQGDLRDFMAIDQNRSGMISQGEIEGVFQWKDDALEQVEALDENVGQDVNPK